MDPILGTRWDGCRLSKILLNPSEVYESNQTHFLPGVGEKEQAFLFGALPHVSCEIASRSDIPRDPNEILSEQESRSETLKKILDLKNGNKKAIEVVNKARIVDAFGDGKDCGSTNVQGRYSIKLLSVSRNVDDAYPISGGTSR